MSQLSAENNHGTLVVEEEQEDLVIDCFNSVTRIRLVKTENPSACVKVNYKFRRSAIALYCL
jgi:hypothetical protein